MKNKDILPDNSITLLIYDVIDEWYSDLDYAALESGVIGVVIVKPKDISILKEMIRDTLVGTFHSTDVERDLLKIGSYFFEISVLLNKFYVENGFESSKINELLDLLEQEIYTNAKKR